MGDGVAFPPLAGVSSGVSIDHTRRRARVIASRSALARVSRAEHSASVARVFRPCGSFACRSALAW